MDANTNLWIIFSTGLLTGGLTCLAVQGGLLAAAITQREEEKLNEKNKTSSVWPILFFVAAKLAAYTVLGFLLGWFGSFFKLSIAAQVALQILVGLFMLGTALSLLDVHPVFRYFIIQPPKFLTRKIRSTSKSRDVFAPVLLGAFTVFIPCGTTQAMMALSVASGSPLKGAAILFAFILGTTPLFFILGYFAARLGDVFQKYFLRVAAIAVIALALFNINNAMALSGSRVTLGNMVKRGVCSVAYCEGEDSAASGQPAVTEATIEIGPKGYTPSQLTVKAGSQVTIHLINNNAWSCAQAFTIPQLNIQKIVHPGSSDAITFTAPSRPTQIAFMCSMGMYRGVINVN